MYLCANRHLGPLIPSKTHLMIIIIRRQRLGIRVQAQTKGNDPPKPNRCKNVAYVYPSCCVPIRHIHLPDVVPAANLLRTLPPMCVYEKTWYIYV
jgi:hypothetical protein